MVDAAGVIAQAHVDKSTAHCMQVWKVLALLILSLCLKYLHYTHISLSALFPCAGYAAAG